MPQEDFLNGTTHESYGTIDFAPIHGDARTIFGSPLKHTDCIRLTINTATLSRNLGIDRIFSKDPVLIGYLSYAQLAQAILSTSRGPSIPLTIEYVTGDAHLREEPPERNVKNLFNSDVNSIIQNIMNDCDELAAITKGSARRKARGIKESIPNSFPFIRDVMEESFQNTAEDAKTDIANFLERRLREAGLDHLTNLVDQEALQPFTHETQQTPAEDEE